MIRYTNHTEFNLIITYEIMQKVGKRDFLTDDGYKEIDNIEKRIISATVAPRNYIFVHNVISVVVAPS